MRDENKQNESKGTKNRKRVMEGKEIKEGKKHDERKENKSKRTIYRKREMEENEIKGGERSVMKVSKIKVKEPEKKQICKKKGKKLQQKKQI